MWKSLRPIISIFCLFFLLLVFPSCSNDEGPPTNKNFRLIGEQKLDLTVTFQGSHVGGISGIDMNPDGSFYLLSDDDGTINKARFYKGNLDYDASSFKSVTVTDLKYLKTPAGENFPSFNQYMASSNGEFADPESIRYDAATNSLLYTSEGSDLNMNSLPIQPFVRRMDLNGNFLAEISTPDQFRYIRTPSKTGFITNATLEAMTLVPGTNLLWLAAEAALMQDGERATYYTSGAPIRLALIDWKANQQVAQYAYQPESNPIVPIPADGSSNNGIPEVLAIDENRLMVLERSFSVGYPPATANTIRLYEVDFTNATDIKGVSSLKTATYNPVGKKLLLDFNTQGLKEVDNIEAMAWGKTLPNGNRTIVFVTDNNFSTRQLFQFFVFEVIDL